jgi:Lrp/AsnC family transcriptional regulator
VAGARLAVIASRLRQRGVAIPWRTQACSSGSRLLQQLRESGVTRTEVAILDAAALNLPVRACVSAKTAQHNAAWLERFAHGVTELPEVVELYRMSGDIDYLLRVVVTDIQRYNVS